MLPMRNVEGGRLEAGVNQPQSNYALGILAAKHLLPCRANSSVAAAYQRLLLIQDSSPKAAGVIAFRHAGSAPAWPWSTFCVCRASPSTVGLIRLAAAQ